MQQRFQYSFHGREAPSQYRLSAYRARFSRTDGAAAFLRTGAGVDDCLPDVALRALPPDPAVATRHHHPRGEIAVERGVPLGGDLRLDRHQVVEARQDFPVGAVRTACAARCAGSDDRRIAVSFFAPPPDLAVAGGRDLLRRQSSIFSQSHSAARAGYRDARSFSPCTTVFPVQTGQSVRWLTREATDACHEWPLAHFHQTLRRVPAVTISGVSGAFFSASHWAARFGATSASVFSPATASLPAQTGQPQPETRDRTCARQECPFSQRHQTRR